MIEPIKAADKAAEELDARILKMKVADIKQGDYMLISGCFHPVKRLFDTSPVGYTIELDCGTVLGGQGTFFIVMRLAKPLNQYLDSVWKDARENWELQEK